MFPFTTNTAEVPEVLAPTTLKLWLVMLILLTERVPLSICAVFDVVDPTISPVLPGGPEGVQEPVVSHEELAPAVHV